MPHDELDRVLQEMQDITARRKIIFQSKGSGDSVSADAVKVLDEREAVVAEQFVALDIPTERQEEIITVAKFFSFWADRSDSETIAKIRAHVSLPLL